MPTLKTCPECQERQDATRPTCRTCGHTFPATPPPKASEGPTLIECPACHKPVSNQAPACPQCGQPLLVESKSYFQQANVQIREMTSTPLKLQQALAVTLMCLGAVASCGFAADRSVEATGVLLGFSGLVWLAGIKGFIWWRHNK